MIIDYKWVRHIVPPVSYLSGISTDVTNHFAAYMSDLLFGTRVRWQVESTDAPGTYYWRFRVVTAYAKLIDIEVEYTFTRPGSVITSETLRARTWNTAGTAPDSAFTPIPVVGNGPGDVTFDALFPPGSTSFVNAEDAELIFPGTTQAQYEHRDGSYSLLAGGIGLPGGLLGVGGFDIRMLAIKNLRADKMVTNLSSDENTVDFKMDIYALPGATSLFPAWEPASDVIFGVQVGDLSANELYYEFIGGIPTSTPTPAGLVASISIPAPFRWPGTDLSNNIVEGLSLVLAQAVADNDDGIPTESVTRIKESYALTYQCCSCSTGCMTQTVPVESASSGPYGEGLEPALSYTSFDYGQLPASLGYGWSSEASCRIIDQPGELIFKAASGGYARWVEDSPGVYVPFNPGNYTEAEVDSGSSFARYKLTFKDQSVYEFNTAGKLQRKVDRNGNAISYGYNGTTGYLETISDGNGRSLHYTNRSDGQPLTMRVNDATTGRLTQFVYYGSGHPDSPDRLHKIIDPEGNETEFAYYPNGPLWYVIDPQGNLASIFGYDSFGRILAEISYGEIQRTYFYGTSSSSLEVLEEDLIGSEPDRSRISYFDKLGNTVRTLELVDPLGPVINETLMEYNDPGVSPFNPNPYLLVKKTDPNLTFVEMTYTDNGNLKSLKDKDGNVTTYTYAEEIDSPLNPKHRNLVREIQRPQVTIGVPSPVTYDPTVFEYDANGNLERVTDASGEVTEMTYSTDGLVLTLTNRLGHTTEFEYEGLPFNNDSRNLLEVKVPKGDGPMDGFRVIEFEHDDYDNVTLVRDALGNEVVTNHDDLDRVIDSRVRDPLGSVVGGITSFDYLNTLLEEVTLPANSGSGGLPRKTTMVYDTSNRLEEVNRDIDSLGAQELRVGYGYTAFSQLARLTRIKNGNPRSFTYSFDRLGRPVTSSDSLLSPNTGVSSMAYAPYCNENSGTSARGIRRHMLVDDRCLPRSLSAGDPDPGDSLEVINLRELREWQHDELGRMVKSRQTRPARYGQSVIGLDVYGGQAEERLYLFDELDRLRKMTFEDGSEMLWDYDKEGNLTVMTDAQGNVTRYAYYRDNLLKEVRIERPSQPDRVFGYSYDDAGRLLAVSYPTTPQVVAKFDDGTNTPGSGWDAKGRLKHLRYERNGDLIRRFEFDYDASDNRTMVLDVTDGSVLSAKAVKWEFLYDWLDRLVTVNRSEAANVGSLPMVLDPFSSYTYDESDNRVTYRDEVADRTYRYVMDDADNLIEVYLTEGSNPEVLLEEIESDADGNMTERALSGETITYKWNDFDRLVEARSDVAGRLQGSRYDVNGIRKRKLDKNHNSSREYTAGITTSAAKPGTSGSSAPNISYLMGHQILGAEVNGAFQFWLTDHLGSVRDIIDENGDVIQSYEFNEHGIPMPGSGASSGIFSPKTYQGALSVNDDTADSGLWLMGHRHFDSTLGRFISRDPIGFTGGLNLFNGAGASPVTFVDPAGLWCMVDTPNGNLIKREYVRIDHPTAHTPESAEQYIRSGGNTGGKPWRAGVFRLLTNDRKTWIEAYRNLGKDQRFNTNCHGQTFTDGEFWINNSQVEDLLTGEGYKEANTPKVGDVVVYRKDGNVVHSVKITDTANGITVTGLGGTQVETSTAPIGAESGGTIQGVPYDSYKVYEI